MAERITCGDSDMRHSFTGKGQQNILICLRQV